MAKRASESEGELPQKRRRLGDVETPFRSKVPPVMPHRCEAEAAASTGLLA